MDISPRGLLKLEKVSTNYKYMISKLVNYIKDVRLELRKVNWPTRNQTIKFTVTVIAVSLGVAVILGTMDVIFSRLLTLII